MTNHRDRILRSYRTMGPTKFHGFNQGVRTALADKARFPDSMWTANPTLLSSYFTTSEKHDAVYHESMLGSRLVIAERDVLQAQLVTYLDQIVYLLELVAFSNPDILIASGFELAKDRRGHARAKAAAAARNAAHAGQEGGETETPA